MSAVEVPSLEMPTTLQHPEGSAELSELGSGRRRVEVTLTDPGQFSPARSWETAYPPELIESILEVKGPAYLCDEIRRDEDPSYVALFLEWAMLAYVDPGELAGKRLLDFGCGSGASTAILARMFPETEIVGVELEERFLTVARERAQFYGNDQVRFLQSPSGERLPDGLGTFDLVSFSAVFEHLLPSERSTVLRAVWATLEPEGVLFLNQTPHRFYPHEYHTTGLPLLNYLPDRAALAVARRFSRRVAPDQSWESLLRAGIRGGTVGEILGILEGSHDGAPLLLQPARRGLEDHVDLWYSYSTRARPARIKRLMRSCFKLMSRAGGTLFAPSLELAIRKAGSGSSGRDAVE